MKTYQLLRNNKSMGYYTEICLLQIGLQPLDLLWIDGESITWKYPSELEEFRTHVSQPAFSQATLVNDLKEKQILYFGSHIAEMDYKKRRMDLIQHPDAIAGDMTPGFEYMLRAQDMRLNKTSIETVEISEEQRAVDAVRAILNKSEKESKASKMARVSEEGQGIHNFTSIWHTETAHDEAAEERVGNRAGNWNFVNSLTAAITGLIALASSAFMNFRF